MQDSKVGSHQSGVEGQVLEEREVVLLVFAKIQLPTCPRATARSECHLGIRLKLEHVRFV